MPEQSWYTCVDRIETVPRNSKPGYRWLCCRNKSVIEWNDEAAVYEKRGLLRADTGFPILILSDDGLPEICRTCKYHS